MGKVSKGVGCSIVGCGAPAVRSLSSAQLSGSGLQSERGRRSYLCQAHYKQWKKESKKEREFERARFI